MLADRIFHQKIEQTRQNRPDTLKMTNGLGQHLAVEESTSIQWVNLFMPGDLVFSYQLDELIHQLRGVYCSNFFQFSFKEICK